MYILLANTVLGHLDISEIPPMKNTNFDIANCDMQISCL